MSASFIAEWQETALERHLSWISSADNKAMSVFAFDSALLAAIAYLAPSIDGRSDMSILLIASAIPAMALIACSLVVFPRLSGPPLSLIYFGRVCRLEEQEYEDAVRRVDPDAYVVDLMQQCHRNAQIAAHKFAWLRRAFVCTYAGIPVWIASIYYFAHHTASKVG